MISLKVLKRFRHPNIVALYGFNITIYEKSQCLVYEYVANGALNGFLMDEQGRTRLPSHVRISIMFQVARAVNFLHTGGCDNLKIFHRDIKSGNICLTQDYTAKLIDCGMSKFVPDDTNVSHEESVTPTMLKSSGAAVFGTPGYICPDYAQGDVPYTTACDVYSMGIVFAEMIVGCLQGGQSSRSGQNFGNFYRRYINDKYHEKVENGLEILLNDGDPAAEWSQHVLQPLCELVLQCLAASPFRRPTTNGLVQKLGLISKTDFRGADSGMETPGSNDEVRQIGSKELLNRTYCILCHESVTDNISCPKMHATCVPCMEHRIQESIGRSGDGVCCGIVGCNTPFTDDSVYGKISPSMYKEYVTERGRQKDLDQILKALDGMLTKKHMEVMTSLKDIQSLGQRSLKGLAYLATESIKKCPTLVWIVPAERTVGRSHRDWIKWAKNSTTHRRYHVYFVCQHSFCAVDVEPRIEIDVPRSWMVQAAPVLRLSMFAIRAALAVAGPLPFPFPDILPKEQMILNEEFVNSFLDDEATKLLNAFESACTRGIDLPQSESSKLATLTGPAYDGIVEKATKLKRTHWKQQMVPVMNQDGSLIWIKNEYKDLY
jgi:Protein kinase domain